MDSATAFLDKNVILSAFKSLQTSVPETDILYDCIYKKITALTVVVCKTREIQSTL